MGAPKASSAMRTISMARTTPAQKPRGFNSSRVLELFKIFALSKFQYTSLHTRWKLYKVAKVGQVSPMQTIEDAGINSEMRYWAANGSGIGLQQLLGVGQRRFGERGATHH